MYENFRVVGISHHTSSLEQREMYALNDEANRAFLRTLREVLGLDEALIISTCNRTEIYYSSESDRSSEVISMLQLQQGLDPMSNGKDLFSVFTGKEALNHLYDVALGLDAKVLGDIQISNQIKRAYQASADEQMAGPFLHRVMHAIFYANKRVVQETAFRDGAASTSYASVEIIKHFITNFRFPKILVLGLGEIGTDVAGNLSEIAAEVTLANRTLTTAQEIASQYQYHVATLADAIKNICDYDVIISSVAVSDPLIKASTLETEQPIMKLLIDLSVPRSIDQEVEKLPGILLYNIDQIEEKTTEIQQKRQAAIPEVVNIKDESIADLANWAQEMEFSPTIKKLKQALDDIRKEEMARFLKNATEKEALLIDKVTKNMIQKVIKLPVLQLKAACRRGDADNLVEVLTDLFDLEKQNTTEINTSTESKG